MIEMERKIKGARTSTVADFKEFELERNRALLSLDERKIKAVYERWAIKFPGNGESFWEAVAKNILRMPNAPADIRVEAVKILDELNIEFE